MNLPSFLTHPLPINRAGRSRRPFSRIHARARLLLATGLGIGVGFAFLAEKISPKYEMISPIGNLNVIQTVYASESTWSNYDLVTFYAKQYGVDVALAHCIAKAESTYQSGAVGDSGKAVGVYQWHPDSWRGWRKRMGKSTKDTRFVAKDNIETAMFTMSKGGYKNWSPYNDGRCK